MHGYVESQALVAPAEETRHEDKMTGARNGQKFGQPLHHGKDDNLNQTHFGSCLTTVS